MPPAVRDHIDVTRSISLTGSRYSGEGADFKMEEVNRGVQRSLPAVPHDEDWIRACVNHAHLLNLRQACFDEMNVLDPRDEIQQKVPCINQQVDAVRALIRERRYLSAPEQEDRVKALNGDPLNQDLKNLASKARLKKSNFMVAFYEGFCMDNEMTLSFKEPPLFVTPDERAEFERIDRRTVIEIEAMIKLNDVIATIIDPDLHGILSEEFVEMFHRGKKPLKRSYIDFYLYVKSCSELSTDEPESD
ncbi:hypothetical protein CAPTEDRAFT_206703 [Capitella teleta]|uniref:Uncharacterized protein n=1 Tax=Capitella teleta TaxID=283909 RepID=R7VDY4_CAPTE|nr:hypothetical protein CAPTEDRAFT_206703 [Capitella teleta]|eukprot:ELU16762.1 hypothetical protein CAPTEDRAFT_206703 [Capitella teleta]